MLIDRYTELLSELETQMARDDLTDAEMNTLEAKLSEFSEICRKINLPSIKWGLEEGFLEKSDCVKLAHDLRDVCGIDQVVDLGVEGFTMHRELCEGFHRLCRHVGIDADLDEIRDLEETNQNFQNYIIALVIGIQEAANG